MSKLKQYKMFINGEWVDSESKKTFETLNPEHNEPWAVVPEASAKDVDNAVKAAQKAFEGEWPKLLPREAVDGPTSFSLYGDSIPSSTWDTFSVGER